MSRTGYGCTLLLGLVAIVLLAYATGENKTPAARPRATITVDNSPEGRVRMVFAGVFPSRTPETLIVNDRVVTLRFALSDLSAGVALMEGRTGFARLACALRAAGFVSQTYQITGTVQLVDPYGNVSTGEGIEMILGPAAYNRMNCDNPGMIDLARIAERYDVHPALQ